MSTEAKRGRGSDAVPAVDPPMKVWDVALRLGLSVSQVYALAADGTIPAHKVGKRAWSFDRDEIEEYWRRCWNGGAGQGDKAPADRPLPARPKGVRHWV